MLGRKQELNLQFQQIVDGVLLVISFWIAHFLRYYATDWFELKFEIPKFDEFRWVLFVLMPFGPIILEMQGYYNHVLQKTIRRSVAQIARGAIWMAALIAVCVLFFRLDLPSRAVLI